MHAKLAGLVLVTAIAACGEPARSVPEGGASIHVLFDERHGLEGGELVRLHGSDIGVVEAVDLSRSRVRATVSLSPETLANLTKATTFTVKEEDGRRYLETYVLDDGAEALADGASVEGADGSLELMAMRASAAAGNLAEDARASEWWGEASEFVDDVKREIDEIDWSEEEKELRRHWEETIERMDEAAEEGRAELGKLVDELVKKLEEVGRSDEAQKLKQRFEELAYKLTEGS
jgi:hypothetical protein